MPDSVDSNVRTFTVDAKHLKVSAARPVGAMRQGLSVGGLTRQGLSVGGLTRQGLSVGGLTRRATSRMSGGSAAAAAVPVIGFDRAPASLASQTRVSEVIQTAGNAVAASPDALTVRTVPAPAISGNGGMGGSAAPIQGGGQAKVILGGKKNRTKVLLSQKRNRVPTVQIPVAGGVVKPTHKKTRKITIKLQGLKRRMTKARKTARMSKTLPISHIRKELMDRKLIKPSSKAPEGVLRAMYSDAKIVANKSL